MRARRAMIRLVAGFALAVGCSLATASAPPPARTTVVLSFDDGDTTQLLAAKLLGEQNLRGTFYVNSASLDTPGKLTGRQLAAIAKAGHEIGGHTLTHARLTDLNPDEQRVEICDDRRRLTSLGLA